MQVGLPLTDVHLGELKRELQPDPAADAARWAVLLKSDYRAVVDAAVQAMRIGDRGVIAAIGEAVIARGMLGFKPLRRAGFIAVMINILIEEGRFDLAQQVLAYFRSDDDSPSAKGLMLEARTLTGMARLKDARQAVARALEIEPQIRGGHRLLGLIDTVRALKPRVAQGDAGWPELRRLAEAYQGLELHTLAAKLIHERIPAMPAPTQEDYGDALELLKIGLPQLGPEFVLRQTPALRPVAGDDRLKALIAECQTALGRPDKAVGVDEGGRDLRLHRALACAAAGDIDEAVARLGRLTLKLREDLEVRAALAYWVGAHVLREAPLVLRPPDGARRIFNLMPFNDEIAILKMHLAEMADLVDVFVIVESEVTFTGQPKPLHFQAHKDEFAGYGDKIRHVVVSGHPPAFHSPWSRDFRQRDMAVTALSGLAAPDDLVLLTDVDEIVDHRALDGFDGEFAGLRMAMFRYFLNYRPAPANFPVRRTGAVWKARHLQKFGSSYARFDLARRKQVPAIDHAGWHFTSVGAAERLVSKVNSYAHQERAVEWRDLDAVERRLAAIRSGRFEPGWERAEVHEAMPGYVVRRLDEFQDLLI